MDFSWLLLGGFGLLALAGGGLVVSLRDPVYAVLSLILTMLSLAGVYFLLEAQYVGIIQIIVYAGAILVTFLFVVMLISLSRADITPLPRGLGLYGPLLVSLGWFGLLAYGLRSVLTVPSRPEVLTGTGEAAGYLYGTVAPVGKALFTAYFLPFELLSFTLLVGIVGAMLLVQKKPAHGA